MKSIELAALKKESDNVAKAEEFPPTIDSELAVPVSSEEQQSSSEAESVEKEGAGSVEEVKPNIDPIALAEVATSCGMGAEDDDVGAAVQQTKPQCTSSAKKPKPFISDSARMKKAREARRFEALVDNLLTDIMAANEDFDDDVFSVKGSKKEARMMKKAKQQRARRHLSYY